MKHPSEYRTIPFNGVHVMVVDAGTVIKDERTGDEVTVTDKVIARKGSVFYVTQPYFDALKAQFPQSH